MGILGLQGRNLETTVRTKAPLPRLGVNAKMKLKIQERMGQLLRSEQNRKLMSDALARGAERVVLKDEKDHEVTIHLQRTRELAAATR